MDRFWKASDGTNKQFLVQSDVDYSSIDILSKLDFPDSYAVFVWREKRFMNKSFGFID